MADFQRIFIHVFILGSNPIFRVASLVYSVSAEAPRTLRLHPAAPENAMRLYLMWGYFRGSQSSPLCPASLVDREWRVGPGVAREEVLPLDGIPKANIPAFLHYCILQVSVFFQTWTAVEKASSSLSFWGY